MKKLKLEIKIEKIDVDERYFEIHYKYSLNGETWQNDMYDSDWSNGMTVSEWREILEDGYALERALQEVAEKIKL